MKKISIENFINFCGFEKRLRFALNKKYSNYEEKTVFEWCSLLLKDKSIDYVPLNVEKILSDKDLEKITHFI